MLYSYGASTGQPRLQFRTEQNWADNTALSRGFMVVDNSLTDSLYNSNRVLVAETTMMMKEHIVDSYGEIKYMMGNGCSGGSIQQNTVASIFPGLLDGIQPELRLSRLDHHRHGGRSTACCWSTSTRVRNGLR